MFPVTAGECREAYSRRRATGPARVSVLPVLGRSRARGYSRRVRTYYAKSGDGTSLAYQVLGEQGPTVVYVPGAISNLMLGGSRWAES